MGRLASWINLIRRGLSIPYSETSDSYFFLSFFAFSFCPAFTYLTVIRTSLLRGGGGKKDKEREECMSLAYCFIEQQWILKRTPEGIA